MSRKANRHWGHAAGYAAMNRAVSYNGPTKFELLVEELRLFTHQERLESPELKAFAKRYGRVRYVPEDLLKAWGLFDNFEHGVVDL